MDQYGSSSRYPSSSNGPPPRSGENEAFDDYVAATFPGVVNSNEIRKAAWATWKTAPPSAIASGSNSRDAEDDDLAKAVAMSMQEQKKSQAIDLTGDDEEDEELQRAIAMSQNDNEIRKSKRPKRDETPEEERRAVEEALKASQAETKDAVEISDDEDLLKANEEFQARRAAERAEEQRQRDAKASATSSQNPSNAPSPPTSNSGPVASGSSKPINGASILGDRAQLEKERLARQAARQAQAGTSKPSSATSAPSSSKPSNIRTFSEINSIPDAGPSSSSNGNSRSHNHARNGRPSSLHPFQMQTSPPNDAAGEYFLDGEMRHSALEIGEPSTVPTFSPQQVLGKKDQISLIIMSSFVLDDEWMDTLLPPAEEVPRIVIRPHPKTFPAWNGKVQAQDNHSVHCYPQMNGDFGSAHMKFFWIFYKSGRLRVCILTANMVHYDWDWIENTIFVQDFLPKTSRASSNGNSAPTPHDFPSRFKWLFAHLKVHKALRHLVANHPKREIIKFRPDDAFKDMDNYDWSRVKIKLVMSVPGSYNGIDNVDNFGLSRLGAILDKEGWKPQQGEIVKAEFQGSSLGTYSLDWFDTFYQYCSGKTTTSLTSKAKPISWPPIQILFPTTQFVKNSILGPNGGGTMFCGKAMNAVTRPLFHASESKRGGVLMHAKVLVALFEPRPDNLGLKKPDDPKAKRKADEITDKDAGVGGWMYIGSHNFSPSAWGRVNLKKKPPTLSISNYELGFVLPLPRRNANAVADVIAPYKRPVKQYQASDTPWNQYEHAGTG